jgi:hypothetical protein
MSTQNTTVPIVAARNDDSLIRLIWLTLAAIAVSGSMILALNSDLGRSLQRYLPNPAVAPYYTT